MLESLQNIQPNEAIASNERDSCLTCKHLRELQVCSHSLSSDDPAIAPHGSALAIKNALQAGASCFDLDVILLKDQTLLSAHPKRFQHIGTLQQVEQMTFEALQSAAREAAISLETLMTLQDALGMILEALPAGKLELPKIMIDMKGRALSEEGMTGVVAAFSANGPMGLKLASSSSVYIDPLERNVPGASWVLRTLAQQSIPFRPVCAYYDRRPDGSRDGGDSSFLQKLRSPQQFNMNCSFLSVSAGLDPLWLRAAAVERELFLWTVDDMEALEKVALKACATAVITNFPMKLHAGIKRLEQHWDC